jgi:hypothetical protein
LERAGDLDAAGGAAYISTLGIETPTAVHVVQYAQVVQRKSQLRRIAEAGGAIREAALGGAGEDELSYRYSNLQAALSALATPATNTIGTSAWLEPEDRGAAVLSEMGGVEYVEDFVRPGRIVVVAAEEGTGKSYAIDDELAIRVSFAGGSFAETWPVLQTGPVLVLSEMHTDDDFEREETALASLNLERPDLVGHYFRLPLMTAAGGKPVLTEPEWMRWITGWLRDHKALVMIVDTATTASNVDPWGEKIQAVYAALRGMLAEYPALAIILIVHLKKPQGRGERRLSDVLGEWGRWNDVTVLMENDGASLERCKITVRKRVRHERRIVATKCGGLLVDALDADTAKSTKVPLSKVIATVVEAGGMSLDELALKLDVSRDTAGRYADAGEADGALVTVKVGPKRQKYVYPAEPSSAPPQSSAHASAEDVRRSEPPIPETSSAPPHALLSAEDVAAEDSPGDEETTT